MWTKKIIAKTTTAIRFRILQDKQLLSFQEIFLLWSNSIEFRTFYIELLATSPFPAFYWEHPGLRTSLLTQPYEFVVLISNSLEKRALNKTAFADFFHTEELVVDFDNLGKNARLVVPTPLGEIADNKHLGKFIRTNKSAQQQLLFQKIGQLMLKRVDAKQTVWLNTAGNGVIWLHIRLDSRPKYYKTQAYRNPDFLVRQTS